MFNQNWHAVTEVTRTTDDVAPDTQLTDAWATVLRMDDQPAGSEGPEIVINAYGDYSDPNFPEASDIVVTVQIGYEVREADGDVNDADYLYDSPFNDKVFAKEEDGTPLLEKAAEAAVRHYARHADRKFDWTGESAMVRKGGPVTR